MPKIIKAFRCAFCFEIFDTEPFCEWHENRCDRNPSAFLLRCNNEKACETCKHLWFDRDRDKSFDISIRFHCHLKRLQRELRKNCDGWEMSDEAKKAMKRNCKPIR